MGKEILAAEVQSEEETTTIRREAKAESLRKIYPEEEVAESAAPHLAVRRM